MKLTLAIVKGLQYGDVLHFDRPGNRNGCERWKVSGQVKTWKRDESRVRVPLKHGLYAHSSIDASDFDSRGDAIGTVAGLRIVSSDHPCEFCGLTY